jgi:asparagine synthase (glutamine-hydrolysing)
MCGILGRFLRKDRNVPALICAMRDTMQHRGPDDCGYWSTDDGRLALAHRRLAIIDLSPSGAQPLTDVTKQLQIVFNGEIYNYLELKKELLAKGHLFATETDTEVILAAWREWGLECFSHLNGMFALALWDSRNKKLVLARDRAGEKPLFYRFDNNRLEFASELKALLADPTTERHIDPVALDSYLTYGYVIRESCLLKTFCKLPQAHVAVLDSTTWDWNIHPYWELPRQLPMTTDPGDLVGDLETLLTGAVKRQLVADVPVGVLLSGGIDSSLVTAFAARVSSNRVRTFTVSFPGHGKYDESSHAQLVAKHFGTDHTVLVAEPASVDLLPALARQYDEPLADSSMVPSYLVSRQIRRHCTVALGGDGGDELFGGYLSYPWLMRQHLWRARLPRFIRKVASEAVSYATPSGFKGRNYIVGVGGSINEGISKANMFFDARARRRLSLLTTATSAEKLKLDLIDSLRGLPSRAMALDFLTYLPDDILVKVDRASMLTSLEVRAPFLDMHVLEFAFSRVPESLRADARGGRKLLLRQLGSKVLPKELDLQRKQGFSIPLSQWLKGSWGTFFDDVLDSASPELFDVKALAQLRSRQGGLFRNRAERLFCLVMLELWRRAYNVGIE